MSKKKENINVKTNNFWQFPEKANILSLFFIGIVFSAIILVIGVILYSNRNYDYLPDYEEITYSKDLNPAFIVLSDYTIPDDEIVQTNKIIMNLTKNKKNDSSYDITSSKYNIIGVTDDGYEYLSEYNREEKIQNYAHTHTFASLTSNSKKLYNKLLVKVVYDYKDSDNKISKKVQEFSQKLMKLERTEIDSIKVNNEIKDNTDLVSTFNVRIVPDSSSSIKKVTVDLSLKNSDALDKYKVDFQVFGIDNNGKIYDLVGYYNISTTTSPTFTRTVSIPDSTVINTVIAKMVYLDSEGNTHNYTSRLEY